MQISLLITHALAWSKLVRQVSRFALIKFASGNRTLASGNMSFYGIFKTVCSFNQKQE
jgi:hypothetical protein